MTHKHGFTIQEFCEAHGGISRVLLYRLWSEGRGPRVIRLGRRVIISEEAAADWRKQMEKESTPIHPEAIAL